MIPIVRTTWLNKEEETDGHSPMYFQCDDGNFYYLKYRTQLKKAEFDCLVYEIVCHYLLQMLQVPTPEIALAVIEKGSYDPKKLKKNKRYVHPGIVCFASKEAPNVALVSGLQSITRKSQVNKFENIYDLLKIAMFDLWVDNVDRGRGCMENYNLLMQAIQVQNEATKTTKDKFRWLAFDHAFAFGGIDFLRTFNETYRPSAALKLIESQYFKTIKKHFNLNTCESIVENFLDLQPYEIESVIQTIFAQLPAEWETPESLAVRIVKFLTDPTRIRSVKQLTLHSLKS